MNRSDYYAEMKRLARETRAKYGLTSPRVLKSDMRRIYRDQGIHIDLWPFKLRQVRGAYFNDELGPTVMLAKGLPDDPTIFTMGHELKRERACYQVSASVARLFSSSAWRQGSGDSPEVHAPTVLASG